MKNIQVTLMFLTLLLHMSIARIITLILSVFATGLSFSSQAQSSLPEFTCDGFPYQILSGQLFQLDTISLTYTSQGPTNSPSINGSGFNVVDNYAYALSSNAIYRLGSDGTREFISSGIGGAANFVGTMDYSGNFYGLKRTNRRVLIKMDIAASEASGTTVLSEVTFTGITPPSSGDFVYTTNGSDEFILLARGNTVYRYDFQTLTTSSVTAIIPAGAPSFVFGASWADSTGRIWAFNNATGDVYELLDPLGSSPEWVLVTDLLPNGNNDGFSCSQTPFPALPPLAQDDDFTAQIETDLTGNVIADNGNGVDSDPDGAVLTVLWADPATSAPSNGVISATLSDGSFKYTPNAEFYGVDTFDYVLSDGGFTDSATVTITIPADNSDLPSTYVEALHNVVDGAYLGAAVTLDTSPNSNSSVDATGDIDDSLTETLEFILNIDKTLTLDIAQPSGETYYLQAWIDWNKDDDFDDADEQVAVNETDNDGDGQIEITVNVPSTIVSSNSFIRLRWSSQLGLNISDIAPDGEVEDYEVQLLAHQEITGEKSVNVWDPGNLGLYAIPGNDVIYTITSTNAGNVPSDTNSIFIVDKIPQNVTVYNADIDDTGPETTPVAFTQTGTTGLNFTFANDVGYSNAATAPLNMAQCNYTPSAGYDANITHICFNPKGQFLGGDPAPTFSVSFRARID